MTDGWTPKTQNKRFYERAEIVAVEEGWTVALDGRPIRTPGKQAFVAPRALAAASAAEWAAQGAAIDPTAMPATRAINTAIERIAPQRAAVVDEIAAFAGSDLLCYRADGPTALIAREAAAWDPLLDWCAERFGARLQPVAGVMHVAQDPDAVDRLRAAVDADSDFGLAPLHELTTLSGSLVIALAVRAGRLSPEDGWAASRIDETWQIEQWGEDAEAAAAAERRRSAFHDAARIGGIVDAGEGR